MNLLAVEDCKVSITEVVYLCLFKIKYLEVYEEIKYTSNRFRSFSFAHQRSFALPLLCTTRDTERISPRKVTVMYCVMCGQHQREEKGHRSTYLCPI